MWSSPISNTPMKKVKPAATFELFDLMEPKFQPTCAILIRGEKSSGVSTLFNLLFQQSTRLINTTNGGDEYLVASLTNTPKIKDEGGGSMNRNELDFPHGFLSDLFPNSLNPMVCYKFIDSGNLSEDWFQSWNRYFAGIIFVIDKDKLQTELSYHQRASLVTTILEISKVKSQTGFKIPLMILVNKVEDIDDPIMKQNLEQFELSLKEYINLNDSSIRYQFVIMSSLHAGLYRQFSLNQNFNDMSLHDIIRFCGIELGTEGKVRAREISNHPILIDELNQRITTSDGRHRWMTLTGLSSFVEWFENTIFPMNTSLLDYLSLQLTSLLAGLTQNSLSPSSSHSQSQSSRVGGMSVFSSSSSYTSPIKSQFPTTSSHSSTSNEIDLSPPDERFKKCLKLFVVAHNNYAQIVPHDNSSMLVEDGLQNTSRDYRDVIQQECRRNYEQMMTKLIETLLSTSSTVDSNESVRLSIILRMLSEHKSIDQFQMISMDLWENGKLNAVMIILERLWSNTTQKPFSFDATMNYTFGSFRTPNSHSTVNSVSMTMEAIKHVNSSGSQLFITSIAEKVLIPLIDALREDICRVTLAADITRLLQKKNCIDLVSSDSSRGSSPTHENQSNTLWDNAQLFVIMRLEECAHLLLPSVHSTETQIKLLETVIKKKISIKNNLPGYSICLKEYLEKYPNYKENKFYLYCSVIHSPIPSCDSAWIQKLNETLNYSHDILNSPLLKSETLLRTILLSTNRLISSAGDFKTLSSNNLNFISPPTRIKSEPNVLNPQRSNSPKLERMDSVKRKRGSSSTSSSNIEEVIPELEPPEIYSVFSPPASPPPAPFRSTPSKSTPSRRRLVTGRGEC